MAMRQVIQGMQYSTVTNMLKTIPEGAELEKVKLKRAVSVGKMSSSGNSQSYENLKHEVIQLLQNKLD